MQHNSTHHGLSSSNWGRLLAPGVARRFDKANKWMKFQT